MWLGLPGQKQSRVYVRHIGKKRARVSLVDPWGNHAPGSSVYVPYNLLDPSRTVKVDLGRIARSLR